MVSKFRMTNLEVYILSGLVVLTSIYMFFRWKRRKLYKFAEKIPGPYNYPLLGCAPMFFGKNCEEQFAIFCQLSQKYRSPSKCWFGPALVLLIDSPEDLKIVLNSQHCVERPYVFEFFNSTHGLFSAFEKVWKPHRKLLNPTFNLRILQSFIPIFNEKSNLLVEKIQDEIGEKPFDIMEYFGKCNLETICSTSLGLKLDFLNEKNWMFFNGLKTLYQTLSNRIFKIWLHPQFIYRFTQSYRDQMNASQICFGLTEKVIAMKKEERLKNANASEKEQKDNDEEYNRKPQLYIDQLLSIAEKTNLMSNAAIKDEIDTLIFAATDTSATTMAFTILMLAINQDIQDKVVTELHSVFQHKDDYVDYDSISKLNYMEMVIKETLRLFPVGPITGRYCTVDTKLTKYTIPAGANLIIGIYNVQRDQTIWGDNANVFDPENFSDENIEKRHPYAFIPFSGGPRSCIGSKYAWIQMKITIAYILRNFKFTTNLKMEDLRLRLTITLQLINRHMVQVERRVF